MKHPPDKTIALLRAIRDGEKFSHANRILAPLGQAGLIRVLDYHPGGTAKTVKLTEYGEVWLAHYEKKT